MRRFRDWPLRWKLLALLVAASALPLALAPLLVFRTARRLLSQSATTLLASHARNLADSIDGFHRAFQRSADRLAQLPSPHR